MAVPPLDPTLSRSEPLVIDCGECVAQHTDACDDCVVTFLCGTETAAPVVVDLDEVRALRMLDAGGLAPPLRHHPRTSFGW